MSSFRNLIFRLTFMMLSLFGFSILSGCSGTTTGSINKIDSQTTTTSPSTSTNNGSGNFCSATRAQKIKTVMASGVSKYTAYVSVGSSQVAAQ